MRLISDYNRLAASGSLLQTVHKLHTSRHNDFANSINNVDDYGILQNETKTDMLSTGEPITLNIQGHGLGSDDGLDNDENSGGSPSRNALIEGDAHGGEKANSPSPTR